MVMLKKMRMETSPVSSSATSVLVFISMYSAMLEMKR